MPPLFDLIVADKLQVNQILIEQVLRIASVRYMISSLPPIGPSFVSLTRKGIIGAVEEHPVLSMHLRANQTFV
jgi:hypothetical protein